MRNAPTKEILAWSMYDFANSAFATTILAVVFQEYMKHLVPPEGARLLGMTVSAAGVWALALGTSLAISAAMAPVIGAVCDYSASKKKWLAGFWVLGCAATLGLFFARPGDWLLGSALFIVGNVAFESSVSLNSAFLPELAPPEKLDKVSSVGWGIGYLGGGLCLFLNLLMIQKPAMFGLPEKTAVNYALASVGLWWLVFGLPCMLGVRERASPRPAPGGSLVVAGFSKVAATMRNLRRFRTLALLTLSVLIQSAGVYTVLGMATTFGRDVLKFQAADLIKCFLMIQGVAAVGALLTAALAGRVPTKKALYTMLFVWLAALTWALLIRTQGEFWGLGVVIGLVMGGTQALSRGLQAQLTPPSATAEFFGFYGVTQKLAAAFSIYAFGAVSEAVGVRFAILVVMALFLGGLALLHPVDVATGRRESAEEEKRLQAQGA
jgi:UMF1 family MFS transporter